MYVGLTCLFAFIYSFVGAMDIYFAVDNFKEQKYFWFGFWVMCAIIQTAYIFAIVFGM